MRTSSGSGARTDSRLPVPDRWSFPSGEGEQETCISQMHDPPPLRNLFCSDRDERLLDAQSLDAPALRSSAPRALYSCAITPAALFDGCLIEKAAGVQSRVAVDSPAAPRHDYASVMTAAILSQNRIVSPARATRFVTSLGQVSIRNSSSSSRATRASVERSGFRSPASSSATSCCSTQSLSASARWVSSCSTRYSRS